MAIPFPYLSRIATLNNAGVTSEIIGNYSAGNGPVWFGIGPPAGESWDIARVLVYLEDAGTFNTSGYGALSALSVGIKMGVFRDGVEQIDLLDGFAVKQNTHWKRLCYDITLNDFGSGQTNGILGARWTFLNSDVPIILTGNQSDTIRITVNDNFTGLVSHIFTFQGHINQPDLKAFRHT